MSLIDEVLDLFDFYEALADEKHIALEADGNAHIVCDRLMIRRAISSLLSNTRSGTTRRTHPYGCR